MNPYVKVKDNTYLFHEGMCPNRMYEHRVSIGNGRYTYVRAIPRSIVPRAAYVEYRGVGSKYKYLVHVGLCPALNGVWDHYDMNDLALWVIGEQHKNIWCEGYRQDGYRVF